MFKIWELFWDMKNLRQHAVHLKEGVWKNNSVLIQSDYGYEPITDPDSVLAFLPVTESVTDTESVL